MSKLLLLFVMMATWTVGCETITTGCYGHWVKGPPERGTRSLNKNAHLPYYQCVDENNKGSNLEKRSQF
jgi:hypothetical protein